MQLVLWFPCSKKQQKWRYRLFPLSANWKSFCTITSALDFFLPTCTWTLHQKVQFSHVQIAKMLQICCECEIHIKQFFAAPKSKGYKKLVASSSFLLMAMNCTPKCPMQARTGCGKVKYTAFGTKKGPKTDSELFSLTL